MLYCVLRGPCVDVALQLYEMLPNKNSAFVVLQYVHVKKCEKGGNLFSAFIFVFYSCACICLTLYLHAGGATIVSY